MNRILVVAGLMLVSISVHAAPGDASPPAAARMDVLSTDSEVSAHGNRRPREEVTPEEKAAQYTRMWCAVAGAGGAAVFGVAMRKRLGRTARGV